ncbi:MAG: hypothetical protein IT317_11260 [Anaerolineales bacterium]|nr:hypothetical protein [Anaerolineales bacterium]
MRLTPFFRILAVLTLLAAAAGGPVAPAAAQSAAYFGARPLAGAGDFGDPFMVEDLTTSGSPESSEPSGFVLLGSAAYFYGETPATGRELYRTTGFLTSTAQLADIYPGGENGVNQDFNGPSLVEFDGRLYFTGRTAEQGEELWATDGTLTGTVLVRDVATGTSASQPEDFIEFNSELYFTADDGVHGDELWKTDGTPGGTGLADEIDPGIFGAGIDEMVEFSSRLWFNASANHGDELWTYDTGSGATEFKDIYTGGSNSSYPEQFTVAGGRLFFVADTAATGRELWVTDGVDNTATHTFMVRDIYTGTSDSYIYDLVAAGGSVFFSAYDGVTGDELWKSDGTLTGTVRVADINPGPNSSGPSEMTAYSGALYYAADDGVHGQALWRTTVTTTELVADLNPTGYASIGNLHVHDGQFYFSATDGVYGRELWVYDGLTVTRLTDLNPGAADAAPYAFFTPSAAPKLMFFGANNGVNGYELYRLSTQTSTVISLVKNIAPDAVGSEIDELTGAGANHVYFAIGDDATGWEPGVSDGTPAGTQRLGDFVVGTDGSDPEYFAGRGDGRALFELDLSGLGNGEPAFSDGTPGGTLLLRDVYTGTNGSYPDPFVPLGGLSVFFAMDGVHGEELWRTDGTPGGTLLARDIHTGTIGSHGGWATRLGGLVIFGADDGVHGDELWASDGTAQGTRMISDLDSGAYQNSSPYDLVTVGSRVFYVAYDLEGNDALYFTDGLTATLALDPDDTGLTSLDQLTPSASGVFFGDYGGGGVYNIWWTDGYTYTQVSNLGANAEPIYLYEAVALGDQLFFRYCDLTNGCELWQAGPHTGVGLVRDIYPGLPSSDPTDLTVVGDSLVFAAASPTGGRELWVSDGTLAGTEQLTDLEAGAAHSNPSELAVSGNYLFFLAYTESAGQELWAMVVPQKLYVPLVTR